MNKNLAAFTAALLMCAIMIVFFGSVFSPKNQIALAETDPQIGKTVYLTFDDGPSDKVTPRILDVLKEENVKATFFIIGKNAALRKNIIRREFDEGHTVAVHSYTHDYNEIYSSAESLIKDIDRCNDLIESILGQRTNVYRFPGGSYGLDDRFIKAVTAHGMRYVDWNASICDAEIPNATAEQLYSEALKPPADRRRVVLLAHDSTTKSSTAEALKNIIDHYRESGYSFETF